MIQMELSFTDQVPDDMGLIAARPGSQAWRDEEAAMLEHDKRFPIHRLPIECKWVRGEIEIRCIEGSVVLWGASYWNRRTQTGEGFAPYRKWGPRFAATTKQDAIEAATRYVLMKGGEA